MSQTLDPTTTTPPTPLTQFTWHRQPAAERFVRDKVAEFLARSPEAKRLSERMATDTGTRFPDWVDYIKLPDDAETRQQLAAAGYVESPQWSHEGATSWIQPHGVFPMILLDASLTPDGIEVAIKVDSIADFAVAHGLFFAPDAEPFSHVRRLEVAVRDEAVFYAVERHGHRGFNPPKARERAALHMLCIHEQFRTRRRGGGNHTDEDCFDLAERFIDGAIFLVGRDAACDLFFAAEREFWQRRNRAAQFQKARQDKLGLGWANHDHHTYRSSRKAFPRLIRLWEKLGFELRERFYAGAEAGWGAQVAEQPNTGIVTFNDVDLSPEELMEDFSHNPLPERKELGTVGLWCALHGESFLQAGMHHLECQFDFDALKQQMESEGNIKVMKPFTDFPHLRQAFTEGERWPVDPTRIDRLLSNGQLTAEQAQKFRDGGAIGSHLENLERNEGFKGFNQKGVSEIISRVDPRKHASS